MMKAETQTTIENPNPDVEEVDEQASSDNSRTSATPISESTEENFHVHPTAPIPPTPSPKPSTPQKIVFEHNVKSTTTPRSAGLLIGMSKPALIIIGLSFIALTSTSLLGWIKIPGLNGQIKDLKEQVNRLSTEVDRLESENDRYEDLNNQLNTTVFELEEITENLNSTVTELVTDLNEVTTELNFTNQEFRDRVAELAYENDQYVELNTNLTTTTKQLKGEVDQFEVALKSLYAENDALSSLSLQLGNLTFDQNETLIELQATVANFTEDIDRLEALNEDITGIVGFLNDTSLGFESSLEVVTEVLADQIVANQALLLGTLENTYRQRINDWDCEYRDKFRDSEWGTNYALPITDLESVITYLDDRIFDEVCLDASNFVDFMTAEYPNTDLTSHRVVRTVSDYSDRALDFYFPESGEVGITTKEWSDASYSCENLASKYFWTA